MAADATDIHLTYYKEERGKILCALRSRLLQKYNLLQRRHGYY